MDYIKINNDSWDDHNQVYKVISYYQRENSTAVELELELNGVVTKRTVARHQIDWLEPKDW